mgnify:CR=1 FL=1
MNAVHFENKASSVRLKTLLFTKTLGGYFMQAIVETVFDACYRGRYIGNSYDC